MGLTELKARHPSAELLSFWSLQGEYISLCLAISSGCPCSSFCNPILRLHSQQRFIFKSLALSDIASVMLSLNLALCGQAGHTWIIQDTLLKILNLFASIKSLLPCKVIHSQILGTTMWPSLGGRYSTYHSQVAGSLESLAFGTLWLPSTAL